MKHIKTLIALLAICLICPMASAQTVTAVPPGATATVAPPPTTYSAPPPVMVAPPPVVVQQYCQPYTDSFIMGGERRITYGTACLHPDGAWELHPTQAGVNYINRGGAVFIVPAQPFATVVIDDGHHHHHHDY